MNITLIINQIVSSLWYFIPIMILVGILKTPWFKGIWGEFRVNLYAKLLLDKEKYQLIKNVTLPTENGSTQVDHIIVSEFGVFVVETKNMKGWIYGSNTQKTWTQKIYRFSSTFQNPLHQNYKHIKTLELLLGLDEQQFHSVVVFVGDCTLKTNMPENVTYVGGFIRYIKSKKNCIFVQSEVKEIARRIEKVRHKPSFRTHRDHVKHVRQLVAEKKKAARVGCSK